MAVHEDRLGEALEDPVLSRGELLDLPLRGPHRLVRVRCAGKLAACDGFEHFEGGTGCMRHAVVQLVEFVGGSDGVRGGAVQRVARLVGDVQGVRGL